ncbi:unnamed protein product [Parnassius apollo]|uniref:(apollo) hypothetical protein n=1 Tax=Parnassius apollo TaxID=110799 RepID=A0A8S3W4X6_PARAO|nr:unnamed protein product [Parnassius apollo]
MAPLDKDIPRLPCDVSNIKNLDTYIEVINQLTTCISNAVNEGKSVTAVNKRLINLAAEEIRRASNSLSTVLSAKASHAEEQSLKNDILTIVREEIKKLKEVLTPTSNAPGPTYAEVASIAPKKPAIVIKSTNPTAKSSDILATWKKNISFKKEKYAPVKMQTISNGKIRVEFENYKQCEEAITKTNQVEGLQAEESKNRSPLIILKGITKETAKEELIEIISYQNSIPEDALRLCFLTSNKNNALYNAVLEVTPKYYTTITTYGRVAINHQRVFVGPFSRFVQCHLCLQFGHTKTKCAITIHPCAFCASEDHNIMDCPNRTSDEKRKCYNCHKHNLKTNANADIRHNATNVKLCPRIISIKKKLEESTDYGLTN